MMLIVLGSSLLVESIDFFFGTVLLCSCVLLLFIGLASFIKKPNAGSRKQGRRISQTLVSLDDVHTVGPLIDALKLDDSKTHQAVVDALTALLPRLRTEEAHLLNAEQRTHLCRHLSKGSNSLARNTGPHLQVAAAKAVAFRVAILQAFAQVGDSRALPTVERLAQQLAKTAAQKRIQEEAIACLPALCLRAEQERDTRTLLRAAAASDAGAKTLLRAARGDQETAPEQLLRPGPPTSEP